MITVDRRRVVAQRSKYLEELENRTPEDLLLHLIAMAEALRMTLSLTPIDSVVPHRVALGILMHAVAQDMDGNPGMRQIVLENVAMGLDLLQDS